MDALPLLDMIAADQVDLLTGYVFQISGGNWMISLFFILVIRHGRVLPLVDIFAVDGVYI